MNNLKIFVGTYNIAEQKIPIEDLRKWLIPDEIEPRCDLYSIGIQESPKRCCFKPKMSEDYTKKWETSLVQVLNDKEFEILHTASFGVQLLTILVRSCIKQFVESKPFDFSVCVRYLSRKRRTKGAIIVFLKCNGLKLTFISCHFRYGVSKKPRQKDFAKIFEKLKNSDPFKHESCKGDYIFWSGDVNSRLENLTFEQIQNFLTTDNLNFNQLLNYDQLHNELNAGGLMFKGFMESKILFLPTYKFLINSSQLDTCRNPGYADRILYRGQSNGSRNLAVIKYQSVPTVCSSDHKPVFCVFEIVKLTSSPNSNPIRNAERIPPK